MSSLINRSKIFRCKFTHLKCSTFICAQLRARTGYVAFIDVLTCLIVDEFEAGLAITIETSVHVNTFLRTSAIIQSAFVTPALIHRLVFGIGTVLNGVAYFRDVDAHSTATIEFRFAVACSLRCSWSGRKEN